MLRKAGIICCIACIACTGCGGPHVAPPDSPRRSAGATFIEESPQDERPDMPLADAYADRAGALFGEAKNLWDAVAALLPACRVDDALIRAARRHLAQLAHDETTDPDKQMDYLSFALQAEGSYDHVVWPFAFSPTAGGVDALRPLLRGLSPAPSRCGLSVQGDTALLLAAWRPLEGMRLPVTAPPGSAITVSGRIADPAFDHPVVYLEDPEGAITATPVTTGPHRTWSFTAHLRTPGRYVLEWTLEGPNGPETAALATVWVGVPRPTHPVLHQHPPSAGNDEAAVLRLINRARTRHGVAPVVRDGRLDAVARSHADRLAARRTFGHITGGQTPETRLRAARLFPRAAAENVAKGTSVWRAHRNLMRSPSHKYTILDPRFTHVGIAVRPAADGVVVTELLVQW